MSNELKDLMKRAKTENEVLLIDILLEAQAIDQSIKQTVENLKNETENFNKAKQDYIDVLDQYTNVKKEEISTFIGVSITQLIMATNELNASLKEAKNHDANNKKEKKSFFGFLKK